MGDLHPSPANEGCACGSCVAATDRTERHLRVLQELAEIGMDLAREVRRQALEPAVAGNGASPAPDVADLGLVFTRIARAVCQTVALEARLEQDRREREAGAGKPRLDITARWRARRLKDDVGYYVDKAIRAEIAAAPPGTYDLERALVELDERLADDEDHADFANHTLGELIARICRDLDVTLDLSQFEGEDWAIELAAATAPPGSTPAARCGTSASNVGPVDDPPPSPGRRRERPPP